jgi:hypothetical protein
MRISLLILFDRRERTVAVGSSFPPVTRLEIAKLSARCRGLLKIDTVPLALLNLGR